MKNTSQRGVVHSSGFGSPVTYFPSLHKKQVRFRVKRFSLVLLIVSGEEE